MTLDADRVENRFLKASGIFLGSKFAHTVKGRSNIGHGQGTRCRRGTRFKPSRSREEALLFLQQAVGHALDGIDQFQHRRTLRRIGRRCPAGNLDDLQTMR